MSQYVNCSLLFMVPILIFTLRSVSQIWMNPKIQWVHGIHILCSLFEVWFVQVYLMYQFSFVTDFQWLGCLAAILVIVLLLTVDFCLVMALAPRNRKIVELLQKLIASGNSSDSSFLHKLWKTNQSVLTQDELCILIITALKYNHQNIFKLIIPHVNLDHIFKHDDGCRTFSIASRFLILLTIFQNDLLTFFKLLPVDEQKIEVVQSVELEFNINRGSLLSDYLNFRTPGT